MSNRLRGIIQAIAVACILVDTVIAQSSTNYRMQRVVFTGGAAAASSANFETSVILTPDTRIGAASTCNTGFRISLGFTAFAEALPVPIDLSVRHSLSDPRDVELTWTGADPAFQVYRASSPSELSSILNLYEETDRCGFRDTYAHQEPIVFYLVLPRR